MDKHHSSKRAAFEAELPPKRPGGRPRYVAFGQIMTAGAMIADLAGGGAPEALVYATPLGDFKPRVRRMRRPDGTRAAFPATVTGNGGRLARRADVDVEAAMRFDVLQALAFGKDLACRPGVRVVHTLTAAIRTIPVKGDVVKWASVDDLAQALATGAY